MDAVVCYEVHLLDVGLTVGSEELLVAQDVDNFGDEIEAVATLVILANKAALESHGEIGEDGGVDILGLDNIPTRPFHLIGVVLRTDDTDKIGGYESLGCAKAMVKSGDKLRLSVVA